MEFSNTRAKIVKNTPNKQCNKKNFHSCLTMNFGPLVYLFFSSTKTNFFLVKLSINSIFGFFFTSL